jgi:hypothetical protein
MFSATKPARLAVLRHAANDAPGRNHILALRPFPPTTTRRHRAEDAATRVLTTLIASPTHHLHSAKAAPISLS